MQVLTQQFRFTGCDTFDWLIVLKDKPCSASMTNVLSIHYSRSIQHVSRLKCQIPACGLRHNHVIINPRQNQNNSAEAMIHATSAVRFSSDLFAHTFSWETKLRVMSEKLMPNKEDKLILLKVSKLLQQTLTAINHLFLRKGRKLFSLRSIHISFPHGPQCVLSGLLNRD